MASFRLLSVLSFSLILQSSQVFAQAKCEAAFKTDAELAQIAAQAELKERIGRTETKVLVMERGRAIYSQVIPGKPGMPTFLLMPGVNRGLTLTDPAPTILASFGYGVASFHFSTQPFSISHLPKGERSYAKTHEMTMADFARETEFVAKALKDAGSPQVIPVSLSFSGAVSPALKGFPLIIETVPMTSSEAANPMSEKGRQMLRLGLAFWPFGNVMGDVVLMAQYRNHWKGQVEAITKQFPDLDAKRADDMLEGYARMSAASEGSAWDVPQLPKDTRRVFVLAAGESPVFFRNQLETFREIYKTHDDALLFVVNKSGHVVPSDQPAAYATLLHVTASGMGLKKGVVIFDPSTNNSVIYATPEQVSTFLDNVIAKLPTTDDVVREQGTEFFRTALKQSGLDPDFVSPAGKAKADGAN